MKRFIKNIAHIGIAPSELAFMMATMRDSMVRDDRRLTLNDLVFSVPSVFKATLSGRVEVDPRTLKNTIMGIELVWETTDDSWYGDYAITLTKKDLNSLSYFAFTPPRHNGLYHQFVTEFMSFQNEEGTMNISNKIKKVIFNDPATIIIWTDNTKTIVKAVNEPYDPEKGMAMAIAKRVLGDKGNFNNVFKKWLEAGDK